MLKFTVSEDNNWLSLIDYTEDFEKKQIEISLTKKIHNHFFHPLVKKKHWDGAICFVIKGFLSGEFQLDFGLKFIRSVKNIKSKYK